MKKAIPFPHCAFIFDLDGTLLDSLSGIANALNAVLLDQNLPAHSQNEYRLMVGDGIRQLVSRALPQTHQNPQSIDKTIEMYQRAYNEIWPCETAPFPEIPDLLNRLSQQEIPFSVLSNKTHDVTCRMVSTLLPQFPFIDVLGQRTGIPIKPDPSAALTLTLLMRSTRSNTFFVGDSPIDMKTALNAGMRSVGVSWGMSPEEELLQHGARFIIRSPMQLLNLLSDFESDQSPFYKTCSASMSG